MMTSSTGRMSRMVSRGSAWLETELPEGVTMPISTSEGDTRTGNGSPVASGVSAPKYEAMAAAAVVEGKEARVMDAGVSRFTGPVQDSPVEDHDVGGAAPTVFNGTAEFVRLRE